MHTEKIKVDLPSKIHLTLSEQVYDECYCNFDEAKWFSFNHFINAGLHFPRIMQFVFVLVFMLNGKTSWSDIILCNLLVGCAFTVIWYLLKFYKLPGLSFISCFIGGNLFKYFIHFIPLGIVSFFVLKDWKVFLFCIIGGILSTIVSTILYSILATTKYNDEVAIYVSKFKT